jgi:hypothetical protein
VRVIVFFYGALCLTVKFHALIKFRFALLKKFVVVARDTLFASVDDDGVDRIPVMIVLFEKGATDTRAPRDTDGPFLRKVLRNTFFEFFLLNVTSDIGSGFESEGTDLRVAVGPGLLKHFGTIGNVARAVFRAATPVSSIREIETKNEDMVVRTETPVAVLGATERTNFSAEAATTATHAEFFPVEAGAVAMVHLADRAPKALYEFLRMGIDELAARRERFFAVGEGKEGPDAIIRFHLMGAADGALARLFEKASLAVLAGHFEGIPGARWALGKFWRTITVSDVDKVGPAVAGKDRRSARKIDKSKPWVVAFHM